MPIKNAFWNLTLAETKTELAVVRDGLSSKEAQARFLQFGPNQVDAAPKRSMIVQFFSRFKNPLVLLLLAASSVMGFTGDETGCLITVVIVILSVTLDFLQETQAGKVVDALRMSIAVHAQAIRDGKLTDLPVAELVPGDLIQLGAGDLIPADGRVLDAKNLFVNQAALTGEPYPVDKHSGDLTQGVADLNDANNSVFAGGSVISGTAKVLVYQTGRTTEFGQIAAALADRRPPTAFELGIRHFGLLIMRLTGLLVLTVLIINWSLHRSILESLLFSIALAVGLTPELLPMIVTVTLSRGAVRMAKKQVVVKQPFT